MTARTTPRTHARLEEYTEEDFHRLIENRDEILSAMVSYRAERDALRAENQRLRSALRDLMLRCDGEEGVRADGSNIQTMQASALLRELGEL